MSRLATKRSFSIRHLRYRGGFTLLETLLALALITLLMVTVVASTTLYAQYRYRGIEGARFAQVLMGTMQDLQDDLQSCYDIHEVQPPAAPRLADLSQAETANSGMAQERVLSFSGSQEKPLLFVGRDDAMLLVRQGANGQFGWDEIHPTASQYQILWLAPDTFAIRLPYATDQQRPVEREYQVPTRESQAPGLHRCSVPIVEPQVPRESVLSSLKTPNAAWDKNVEIQQLRFRYFDGTNWQREWNSHHQANRLPLAVEVQLTLSCAPQNSLRFVMSTPRQSAR